MKMETDPFDAPRALFWTPDNKPGNPKAVSTRHLQFLSFAGYYADQLSEAQEVRGNQTVSVKNESRGFHLNNLSYAGPIIMGVGGLYIQFL